MEPFSLSFLDVSQFTDACLLCACLKNLWKQLKPSNMCRAKEESKYICYELFTGYESCALMRFRSQCLISKTILAQTVPQEWEEQVVKERRQHGHQICVAWEYFESQYMLFQYEDFTTICSCTAAASNHKSCSEKLWPEQILWLLR